MVLATRRSTSREGTASAFNQRVTGIRLKGWDKGTVANIEAGRDRPRPVWSGVGPIWSTTLIRDKAAPHTISNLRCT